MAFLVITFSEKNLKALLIKKGRIFRCNLRYYFKTQGKPFTFRLYPFTSN
jgi:hypothetical protein